MAKETKVVSMRLTQGQVAVVDASDAMWLRENKWHASNCGVPNSTGSKYYAARATRAGNVFKRIYMHREIMKRMLMEEGLTESTALAKMKGMFVDHGDGDALNNTRENLLLIKPEDNVNEPLLADSVRARGKKD